jgi:hypothetical protein
MAETLDCDIVLVKEPAVAAAIRARNASVLWQGVSGD